MIIVWTIVENWKKNNENTIVDINPINIYFLKELKPEGHLLPIWSYSHDKCWIAIFLWYNFDHKYAMIGDLESWACLVGMEECVGVM